MTRARVLIADDHAAVLDSITRLLSPHFDVVGAVMNGDLLLQAADALDPDVLVVDISMPVLNGIQAADELRQRGCRAKVVFLTINEDAEIVGMCFSVGAAAYVVKTRVASDLIHAINEALAGRTFVSPNLPKDFAV